MGKRKPRAKCPGLKVKKYLSAYSEEIAGYVVVDDVV